MSPEVQHPWPPPTKSQGGLSILGDNPKFHQAFPQAPGGGIITCPFKNSVSALSGVSATTDLPTSPPSYPSDFTYPQRSLPLVDVQYHVFGPYILSCSIFYIVVLCHYLVCTCFINFFASLYYFAN